MSLNGQKKFEDEGKSTNEAVYVVNLFSVFF
jgi:hypothetical protein